MPRGAFVMDRLLGLIGVGILTVAVTSLVAVLFGSTLFGIPGALMAIPAAATIQIGLHEYREYRKEIQSLHNDPPMHQGPAVFSLLYRGRRALQG